MLIVAGEVVRTLALRAGGATLTYSQPLGGDVVVRLRVSPDLPGRLQEPQGQVLGAYSSASGLTTLAFAPDECRLAIEQRHPLLEEGAQLWSPPEKLDAWLDEIRLAGFGRHPSAGERRLALAVPVYENGRSFAGVLGLSLLAAAGSALGGEDLRRAADLLLAVRGEFGLDLGQEPASRAGRRKEQR
jgi:DNA-binding IclR family transcriptional regulator